MLTAVDLQSRLLEFVRTRLVRAELSGTVQADSRLFEDRLIDSLKILELIAFLESVIGRKIPDAQVLLANFRSVRTIAEVFSTETVPETRPRRSRRARPDIQAPRIFERSTARRSYTDLRTLLELGKMRWDATGGVELDNSLAEVARYLDATVTGWARELGAVEQVFADTIGLSSLETAGYVAAFPQSLVRIDGDSDFALPPAVCYHHYPRLAGRAVESGGSITTAVGRCFRNESDAQHPLERLRAFTMREIIIVGSDSFVETTRAGLIQRVAKWMESLDLDGYIEHASDPFFTRATRGRLLLQQLQPLKYELRLPVAVGRTVAATSFNHHQDHFGRAFSIPLENGQFAHTGCVAFGWERWLLAFAAQHGTESLTSTTPREKYAAAL